MQAYKYIAKSRLNGKPIEALVYANDEQDALKKVEEIGYTCVSLTKIDMQDKRVTIRYHKQMPVWFNRFKPGHESEFNEQGMTINISIGGILFKTDNSYTVGTTLEILLDFSENEEPVQCYARVVRCDPDAEDKYFNIAVSFLDLSPQECNNLNEFLNRDG